MFADMSAPGEEPKFKPTTAGQHMLDMIAASFEYARGKASWTVTVRNRYLLCHSAHYDFVNCNVVWVRL